MADDQTKSADLADTLSTDETSTTTSSPPADSDRRATIEELVRECYEAVAAAPYDEYLGLSFIDHDAILGTVNRNLHLYDGPLESGPFQNWAVALVQTEAQRLAAFHAIKDECEPFVYRAIRNVLDAAKDLGVDVAKRNESGGWGNVDTAGELAQEVWVWTFIHLDELLVPGTAKLTTRLYARARWTARAWKQRRLRERERFPDIGDIARLGRDEKGELFMEPLPILSPDGDAGALYS